MSNLKKITYKNVNRQLIHDDFLAAAQAKGITKTQYARMCDLNSSFMAGMMAGRRHPTDHLLRQLARDRRKAGEKRCWQDYILPDPKKAEPEQMEMDLNTETVTPETVLNDYLTGMRLVAASIIAAHEAGYRLEFSIKKQDNKD